MNIQFLKISFITALIFITFSLFFSLLGRASTTIILNTTNTVSLVGPITVDSISAALVDINELNKIKSSSPIYLYIQSPGGDVSAEELFISIAKQSRRPVHTITLVAASAAFNIVQALGKHYIVERSIMMTHNAFMERVTLNKEVLGELAEAVGFLLNVYTRTANRLKMSYEVYSKFMEKEPIIRGENNLRINTADELVNIQCSKDLILSGKCQF